MQDKAEEEGRPELPNPEVHQDASEDGSHFKTVGQTMLKLLHVLELIRHHIEGWGSGEGGRRVENGDGSIHLSAVHQKIHGHGHATVPWAGVMWRTSCPEN